MDFDHKACLAFISSALLDARVHANMSVNELAARMRVSRNTIHNWEVGKTTPNAVQLVKLGVLCGVQPASFLPTVLDSNDDPRA